MRHRPRVAGRDQERQVTSFKCRQQRQAEPDAAPDGASRAAFWGLLLTRPPPRLSYVVRRLNSEQFP
jgi:hypothetical protein